MSTDPNPFAILAEADLCVVGAICRDVKTAPFQPSEGVLRDGETSVPGISETIGGGGANSAGIAAALGAKSRFAGVVGADVLGERLRQALERARVRCFLRSAPGLATGTTVNLVYTNGQRHFLSCHPNNAALCFEELNLAVLDGSRHLLRADVWFSEPMLYGGNERLFQEARRCGLATSLDLNWDPQWGHAPEPEIRRRKQAVRNVLPLIDLAHGNVRELCAFTDTTDLNSALESLTRWGVGAILVHHGAQGAGYFANGQWGLRPPGPIKQSIVATGTGDVLSVCMMLLHHRNDFPIAEKLDFANGIVAEFMEGRRPLIPRLDL
jgi:sugar/nucleoside kinase (ribokinase family)